MILLKNLILNVVAFTIWFVIVLVSGVDDEVVWLISFVATFVTMSVAYPTLVYLRYKRESPSE
jgi:hypothetical protein